MEFTKEKIAILEREFGMTPIDVLSTKLENYTTEVKRQSKIILSQNRKIYNVAQVAKILGLSRITIEKYIKDGHIKSIEIDNRKYIPNSEINRLNFIK
tara:strand:+ start:492 stop:785 length:294 start_codon:yes stop_codon:yes gene_type:complete